MRPGDRRRGNLPGDGDLGRPFDRWFRDHIRDVHGINVEDGFPPPERVMDFHA